MNAPARRGVGVPLLAIVLGVLGLALAGWGGVAGLDAALSGSGNGSGPFIAMFVAGGVLILGTIVTSIVGVSRPGHRVLWGIALLVGLLPLIAIVVVLIIAQNA